LGSTVASEDVSKLSSSASSELSFRDSKNAFNISFFLEDFFLEDPEDIAAREVVATVVSLRGGKKTLRVNNTGAIVGPFESRPIA
jgi:hypothetical protein